jgi:hypothetical protein
MPRIEVVRAGESDIPFIVATERWPGFEKLVGRWEAAQHAEAMTEPRYAYFLARAVEDGGEPKPLGFALLRDWDSPERSTLLKRIAVSEPAKASAPRCSKVSSSASSLRRRRTGCRSACSRIICAPAAPMNPSASRPKAFRAAALLSAASTTTNW